ncbi:MAG: transketolase [Ottowia sp.]|nr:transketolase [Ottowia sp.]
MSQPTRMAHAIRALAMDAVQKAKSGHPGAPMGMAEMAVALWTQHLKHNPASPGWMDRDRFVLSNGHGSMLLYALLHLSGYNLPLSELQDFRQLGSKTPGHPEWGLTPGVETTTGPLGQGLANAVGMALAEKLLAAEFNREGHAIVDHHTWVFVGDGCLMEGISHEACALAGAWKLDKLVALYDDNGISIDGQVAPWFVDDVAGRFAAYRWNVIGPINGHDVDAVDQALAQARQATGKPTLIICKTHIGKGAPTKQGTADAHGAPLGEEEIAATRKQIGWPHAPFEIPDDVYADWDARAAGAQRQADWDARFAAYKKDHPRLAGELARRMAGILPGDFSRVVSDMLDEAFEKREAMASRKASQRMLEHLTAALPELLGGSADLTGSNLTETASTPPLRFEDSGAVVMTDAQQGDGAESAPRPGRHINYGVREFGMTAIMNGIALHGGFIPYGGTFLTFSDYSRNAIRMASLMQQRVILVFTHDSIGLGEDGPTHQPVEQAASLRLIPGLDVWRPADTTETGYAWAAALQSRNRPTALLLSRQALPHLKKRSEAYVERGGYVLSEPRNAGLDQRAQAILIATGSEVGLAVQAQKLLADKGTAVRVVSMPSTSVFDRQDADYQQAVLPPGVPRIAVEMGVTDGWWKYGCAGVVGMNRFGESAPAGQLLAHFGFTAEHVAQAVQTVLGQQGD